MTWTLTFLFALRFALLPSIIPSILRSILPSILRSILPFNLYLEYQKQSPIIPYYLNHLPIAIWLHLLIFKFLSTLLIFLVTNESY